MVFAQLVDVSFDHLKHMEDIRTSRLMTFENQRKTKTETDVSDLWSLFKIKHYKQTSD